MRVAIWKSPYLLGFSNAGVAMMMEESTLLRKFGISLGVKLPVCVAGLWFSLP